LVNAMCLGIVPRDALMRARASGPGNVVMMVGAATGRDGLHGATFSSVEDPTASHRGVVQVGNPFLEKLLLEACLELLEGADVVAMQDLGAAGLTSSTVECASRGGVGIDIDVAHVPATRGWARAPSRSCSSESQERMLLVVRPEGVRSCDGGRGAGRSQRGGDRPDHRLGQRGGSRRRRGRLRRAGTLFTDACPTYTPAAAEDPGRSRRTERRHRMAGRTSRRRRSSRPRS
jgi:phosphoribosylformylglycinamidine synthase